MKKENSAENVLQDDQVGEGKSDEKLSRMITSHFEAAKQHKNKRTAQIEWTWDFLREFANVHQELAGFFMDKLEARRGRSRYVSPIAHTVLEKKAASDWVPEITIEPEERRGAGSDIYFARNTNRIFQFQLKKGKFRQEMQAGSTDLFGKGRLIVQIGTETREGSDEDDNPYTQGTITKYKHRDWEKMYWTPDDRVWMILCEATFGELIEEFGDEIKNFEIKEGAGAWIDGDSSSTLDATNKNDLMKKVQYMHYYNPDEKTYACLIGGAENFYEIAKGEDYPAIDEFGNGFAPFLVIDGSSYKLDGHPISDLDNIVPICQNYDVLFNSTVEKAKKAARSQDIIGSANPAQEKLAWLQDEANGMADLNMPRFLKIEEGQNLFAKTLSTGSDTNTAIILRNAFIDDVTMTTGINLQLQGKGAETARQEELRVRRELEVIDDNIKINEAQYEGLAVHSLQLLKNTDLDFHDEYISIDDEASDIVGVAGEGTVRDIVKEIKGFPFNVTVSVNQSNAKRKSLEIGQKKAALTTIAPFAVGSRGVAEMAFNIASSEFPGMQSTLEDFIGQAPPQGGAPQEGAQPELGELTRQ